MKVFLTGATGFLGSHAALQLVKCGHQVSALLRTPAKAKLLEGLPIEWIRGDLPELPNLKDLLSSCDAVVHVAGVVKALGRDEFFRVNQAGTANLVRQVAALANPPKRFLHISTIAVHHVPKTGGDFTLPPEQCRPLSYYGASKLAGEMELKSLPESVHRITLRPPVLYGPRDEEFLPMFRAVKRRFLPLWGLGGNRLSICYAEDVARAIADLLEKPTESGSIFCLDDGNQYDWRHLLRTISRTIGKKAYGIPLPPPVFYVAAAGTQVWSKLRKQANVFTLNKIKELRQKNWICGYDKLYRAIGWRPEVGIKEGFARTYEYYRKSGLV